MSLGKFMLVFLGGVAAGAAGLALLNRGKMDFSYMKPVATDLMNKTMDFKDRVMSHVDAMREDLEDLAAEAKERADVDKARGNANGDDVASQHG